MDKPSAPSTLSPRTNRPPMEPSLLRAIVEHSLDITSVLSPEGIFHFITPSVKEHLGFIPDELLGRSAFSFIHPDDQKFAAEQLQRGLASPGTPQKVEARFLHKDGTWRVYESFGTYSPSASGEPLIVVNSRDMTVRAQAMQALQASEQRYAKLFERIEVALSHAGKMEALGRMTGGIAHELNNPLAVILGYSQTDREGLKPSDPLREALINIEREAKRCCALVKNLLTFSHKQAMGIQKENPKALVEEALSLVEALGKVNRTRVRFVSSGDVPAIMADRAQIQQVLINLCTNAMDAMPGGGTLAVGLRAEAGSVELRVSDTGTGIAPEVRERIFEPFFTTKEAGKGTGLGLSIVHEIVKRHKGGIDVQSAVGKGTTVVVRLPVAPLN